MAFNFIQNNGEIDQSAELLQRLSSMCEKDGYADATFIVEGTKISAHKSILSARSSYFESLFGGGFAEADQAEITLKVPLSAFKAMLKYIYTGCLSLGALGCNEIVDVYDLANQYGFDSLKKTILEYLTADLKLENCVAILNAAQLYSLDDLQNACLRFMDSNSTELLDHETFRELVPKCLHALLKRDSFYALEIDIFKAICSWYKSNSDADIKELLSTVRWPELSSKDLADVVLQSKVLDVKEILRVMTENTNNAACRTPSSAIDAGNIATTEHGAKTIWGINAPALLNGDFTNYDLSTGCTYHSMESYEVFTTSNRNQKASPYIIVDLGDAKFINYIEILLFDKDARSYSYYVNVSVDGTNYVTLFDHTKSYHRSWQFLYFQSRPIRYIKLVGTRAIDITDKRDGWHSNGNTFKYDSFDVVGLKAMYKTANIPKLIDGIIKPTTNVATVQCGATVFEGCGVGNKMLNVKLGDFTCHEKGSFILLQLNQAYIIDSLRMLLGNNLNHSNKYSFCIETSLNKLDWKMAVDKREESLTGWQEFNFVSRPVVFIKITGTQQDINFICTYFECPRSLQKPKFKRSHS